MSASNKDLEHMNKMKYNSFVLEFSNPKNFEQKIKNIFNHELKKEFYNILLSTKELFIDSVKEKVFSILSIKYSNKIFDNKNFAIILSKNIQKLNNKYEKNYLTISQQFNAFQMEKMKNKVNKNINLTKYYFSSYRKHCPNSQNYAIHLCTKSRGLKNIGKFIKIRNNLNKEIIEYLVCETCQKTFFSEIISCYCQNCKEVYFSSQLNNDEKNNLFPAALKKTHCEEMVNDLLYCPLCNNILYINLNNNKIECINETCKNNNISEKTEWKCKNCSLYFSSDFKIYNPLEIKMLSEEKNYALSLKIKAKPIKISCCKIDLNMTDFYHSQDCDGLIYVGEFNHKSFVVCEKCKVTNYLENFIWTCPKCKCKFSEIKDNKHEKEKEKKHIFNSNNNGKKINKNKGFSEKVKNFEIKKVNSMERRKRIFSQEYDYDNDIDNDAYFKNNNDENCDINIIKNDYNNYKNKNKKKNKLSLANDENILIINKYDFKKSRNNREKFKSKNFSNNIIFSQMLNSKVSTYTIDTDEKEITKKISILNLTSNNFFSERNNNETKLNNKIKQLGKVYITSSNIKQNLDKNFSNFNKKNSSFEKRKKYFIPHSGININKKFNKNISFFEKIEKKASDNKRKNITPNLFKLRKKPLKSTNSNLITNISQLYINNDTKENKDNNEKNIQRNRSPFLLRRIINFTLGDSSIKEITKNDSNKSNESNNKKNNNKKEEEIKRKNMFYSRFKSSINGEKKEKFKRDNLIHSINLINSNFSSKIRKKISSARNKNKSEYQINKSKEIERAGILSKRELNLKKLIDCKNGKSKSENRLKEKDKVILNYNFKKKNQSKKKEKNEISLKPKDIIEPSKIDLSKDIPIINESIKKDKKLYQDIQRRLKRVLSKGKLPQFFLENYTIIRQLGEGSFGSIYEVFNKDTKIKYAMKKIIANDIHSLEVFQREFEIVHENKHPNILDIHGICIRCLDTTTYVLYVLMDLAEKDWEVEINQRSKKKKYYTEKELISMLKQIVNALCFLQKEKNIAHRDIKPENILLFKNNIWKIADFGEAKKSRANIFKTLRGTEFYMSPILYNNLKIKNDYVKHNPYKSDVFSLGYCIICAAALNFDIVEKIREKNVHEIKIVFNQYIPNFYSKKFMELIFKMIEEVEDKRIDFIRLKQILDKEF